ncbi:MHYT domain-containing protein [Actinoplanes sp. NPDC049265]|uniref:MHYT domain-containing protein n=1 Tax=Actinoplanes sp. NPDC049265 TaxID=3363902 RepID=UPI00372364DE
MAEIHHLAHGWVTPTASYVLSVLGSLLGLTCAVRFRTANSPGARNFWLILAAVAIGGTGIWTMHFVAMLGFDVVGTPIRYDVGLTAASALLGIVAVGIGLAIALNGTSARQLRIVGGGVLAGLGVAGMHYTGMAAMRLDGEIDYSITRVGMSIGIAVVAAAVALWLAVTVRKAPAILAAALIMGVAVNGMHFTGMSAMSVHLEPAVTPPSGAAASQLILPIGLTVVFAVLGLLYALMAAPTDEDRAGLAYLAARQDGPDAVGEAPRPIQQQAAANAPRPIPQQPPTNTPRPIPRQAPANASRPIQQQRQAALPQHQPPAVPQQRTNSGPSLGEQLGSLQREQAEAAAQAHADGDEHTRKLQGPRRMPSANSSWTFRDRADK